MVKNCRTTASNITKQTFFSGSSRFKLSYTLNNFFGNHVIDFRCFILYYYIFYLTISNSNSKGPITWWVSPRAEISAQLTGLKFQTGFRNKSSENQVVDYMERDSARGAIQPGLKILARYSQTGLGFSARPNGLKNPCNRYHFFSPGWKRSASMRIYVFSHLSKLSHDNLRFAPGLKLSM